MCAHISPPCQASFLLPHSPRSSRGTRPSSLGSTALPASPLFHTWWCAYASPNLPVHPTRPFLPCPQVHSLHLHLYFCPANRYICTIFSRLHIYALTYDICFSLSDWLHSSISAKSGFQTLSIRCFQKNSGLKLRTHPLFSDFTGTFLCRKQCHWPKGRDPQGNTTNSNWNMHQFNFTNNEYILHLIHSLIYLIFWLWEQEFYL